MVLDGARVRAAPIRILETPKILQMPRAIQGRAPSQERGQVDMMEELKVLRDVTLYYNEQHPELRAEESGPIAEDNEADIYLYPMKRLLL